MERCCSSRSLYSTGKPEQVLSQGRGGGRRLAASYLPRQQFDGTGPGTAAPLRFPPPVVSALAAERAKEGCVKGREGLTDRSLTHAFSHNRKEEPTLDATLSLKEKPEVFPSTWKDPPGSIPTQQKKGMGHAPQGTCRSAANCSGDFRSGVKAGGLPSGTDRASLSGTFGIS